MSADTFTRRAALVALPAVGLVPAAAVAAPGQTDTPIQTLFSEWLACFVETEVEEFSDDEVAARTHELNRMTEQMLALPSTCSADLAAKVAAATGLGEYVIEGMPPEVWADAFAIGQGLA